SICILLQNVSRRCCTIGKQETLLLPGPVARRLTVGTPHALPAGKISLIFTDIEDSSRMTNALGNVVYLEDLRAPHNQRMRDAITAHHGREVKTMGDAFMVVFARADDALACAVAMQQGLANPPITATDQTGTVWTIKVRIGVHTAETELMPDAQGDYGGGD